MITMMTMKATVPSKGLTKVFKSATSITSNDALNETERVIKIDLTADKIEVSSLQHNVCRLMLSVPAQVESEGFFYVLGSNVTKLSNVINRELEIKISVDNKQLTFESEKFGSRTIQGFYNQNAFDGANYNARWDVMVDSTKGLVDIANLVANNCYSEMPVVLLTTKDDQLHFYSKTDNSTVFHVSIEGTTNMNGVKGYIGASLLSKFKETGGDTHALYWSTTPNALKVTSEMGELFVYTTQYSESELQMIDDLIDKKTNQEVSVKYKDLIDAIAWQIPNANATTTINLWCDSTYFYVQGTGSEPAVLEYLGSKDFKEIKVPALSFSKLVDALNFKQELISLQQHSLEIIGLEDYTTLFLEPVDLNGTVKAHAFINPVVEG